MRGPGPGRSQRSWELPFARPTVLSAARACGEPLLKSRNMSVISIRWMVAAGGFEPPTKGL